MRMKADGQTEVLRGGTRTSCFSCGSRGNIVRRAADFSLAVFPNYFCEPVGEAFSLRYRDMAGGRSFRGQSRSMEF